MTDDKTNPAHYDGDACMRKIALVTRMMPSATAFCVGQAIKYLWRTNRKAGESADDDARKALWYLDWIESKQREDSRVRWWRRWWRRWLYVVNDREQLIIDDLRKIAGMAPELRREKVQDLR